MRDQASAQAVVVGGSMAGLLAARVLSGHFGRVILLEQDRYPEHPTARAGIPQARHLHALLARGQNIIEQLFPGISQDWRETGGEFLDVAADFAWRTPAGWGVRFESGIRMLAASRPLIDHAVRRRVSQLRNVSIVEQAAVDGLIVRDSGTRIAGVRLRRAQGETQEIAADLVVDASGRTSRTPEWLVSLGYEAPRETVINAHLGYATRVFRKNNAARDWKALYIQAAPPERTRAGIAFPMEDSRIIVTVSGGDKDYPPVDEEGFLKFVASLPDPQLLELVTSCEPLTDIVGYRRMENRWRHYEAMRARPEGLVVTGDAACAFNPVYGQGMTAAALGATALGACLNSRQSTDLAGRFQRRLSGILKHAWMLAVGEDLRYRGVEGVRQGKLEACMQWYVDQVMTSGTYDVGARRALLRVFTMLSTPGSLFRPDIVWKVLRAVAAGWAQNSGAHATGMETQYEGGSANG